MVTPSDSHPLVIALGAFADLSPSAVADLLQHLRYEEFPQGHLLLREGDVCRQLYFVQSGFARGYYFDEQGREFTSWFWSEGDILTSYTSLLRQEPARETIELLEPLAAYRLPYSELLRLYDTYPEFDRLGRRFAEDAFLRAGEISIFLRMATARESYDHLVRQFPQLLERSYLKYIASFLGISQETLSRIRASR